VNGVCKDHSDVFDATAGGQSTRAELDAHIANNERLFVVQRQATVDRRAAAEQSRVARATLCDAMRAVVNIDRRVRVDGTSMTTMRMPDAPSDDELVACARDFVNRVSAHTEAFLAAGLPPVVPANLETALQELVTARAATAAARQRFTAATVAIREAQNQADTTVAALASIAVNTPAAHPEVVTKFRIARRVGPRARPGADDTPSPAPAPAPSSPTPSDKAA